VELGARDITLFPSERCVSLPCDTVKKTTRLQRIALETAMQCGRGRIPLVSSVDSFEEAVRQAASINTLTNGDGYACGFSLFFYELEEKLHLKQALKGRGMYNTFSIFTGPEGGFEPQEAEFARAAGLISVSLGARILRCETAPIAALAAVMFHTGNL
jgi:16S rRNA (uracil1498-N3)-methyltransferase